jgi:hypothetical protein
LHILPYCLGQNECVLDSPQGLQVQAQPLPQEVLRVLPVAMRVLECMCDITLCLLPYCCSNSTAR